MLLYMEDYRRTDRPQAGVQCPSGGVGLRLGHAERLTGALMPEAAVKRGKTPSGLEKPVEWVDGYTRFGRGGRLRLSIPCSILLVLLPSHKTIYIASLHFCFPSRLLLVVFGWESRLLITQNPVHR
jgi:hypothetical protein